MQVSGSMLQPSSVMPATYQDLESGHKADNNEWIAFTANTKGKRFRGCSGDEPKWAALLLDGIHARSMSTLQRRVGVERENVVIAEHDQRTFESLKNDHPDCNVVFNRMQKYVRDESFPDAEFNIVFFGCARWGEIR